MPIYNDCPRKKIFPFAYLHPRSCDENFIGSVQDISEHTLEQAGTHIPFLFGILVYQTKFH